MMIEVKLLRIITGEELVAEIVSEDETTITVKNALVVLPSNSGIGFAQWASVIDKDKPEITILKQHVVYVVELDSSVYNKYNEIFGSKLITPDEKKLIL